MVEEDQNWIVQWMPTRNFSFKKFKQEENVWVNTTKVHCVPMIVSLISACLAVFMPAQAAFLTFVPIKFFLNFNMQRIELTNEMCKKYCLNIFDWRSQSLTHTVSSIVLSLVHWIESLHFAWVFTGIRLCCQVWWDGRVWRSGLASTCEEVDAGVAVVAVREDVDDRIDEAGTPKDDIAGHVQFWKQRCQVIHISSVINVRGNIIVLSSVNLL